MDAIERFVLEHSEFELPKEISHSAKGTTWEKKDHKYTSKITKEGKTFYRYDSKSQTYTELDSDEVSEEDVGINSLSDDITYKALVVKYGKTMAAHHFLAKKRGLYYTDSNTPILYRQIIESRIKHSDYLAHHGIKGQQWGVQNGPPYPLDSDTHKSVVKKASKAVSSAGDSVKKTVRKVEANVAKSRETREKEKLESEKQKLKIAKLKAKTSAVKAERDALKQKEKEAAEEKRLAKQEEKAQRKAEKAQKQADKQAKKDLKNAAFKEDIINRGDLKACAKNSKMFTNDEIAQVIYRNNTLKNLNSLTSTPKVETQNSNQNGKQSTKDRIDEFNKKSTKERFDATVDKLGGYVTTAKKISDLATTGISVYNTVADISTANGHPMKKIATAPEKITTNKIYKNGQLINEETVTGSGKTVNQFDLNKTTSSEEYKDGFLSKMSTTTFKDGNTTTQTFNYTPRTSSNDDPVSEAFSKVYDNPTTLHSVDSFITGTKQLAITQLSSPYLLEDKKGK